MPSAGPVGPSESSSAVSMSSARAAVLDAVRQRGRLCTVREIAELFELHPNTVREHLDALLEQGLLSRQSASPSGRGRPALMYRATSTTRDALRDYELLTDVLAEQIATMPQANEIARQAGMSWGARSAVEREGRTSLGDLVPLVGELGFEPSTPDEQGTVLLRACPILGAARRQPGVVCTVHLGYVQALVAEAGGDPDDVSLVPMGSEHGCLLRIGALAQTA